MTVQELLKNYKQMTVQELLKNLNRKKCTFSHCMVCVF